VLDLLQIFGWPAAILLAGVILDLYSDAELKTIVVEYFRGARQPKDIFVSLRLFLHGFLFRLLGNIANLSRFFLRSSTISIIVVIIIFTYQQYHIKFVKEGCYLSCHTQYFFENYVNGWAILTLLFANCVVDYCSNVVTISLIELATRHCNRLQFLVIAAASLSLSVIIFTTIFPIGIVLSVLVHQMTDSSARLNVAPTGKEYFPEMLVNLTKNAMSKTGFQMSYFSITPMDNFSPTQTVPEVMPLVTKSTSSPREQTEVAAQLITGGNEDDSFIIGGKESGWSAFVTVEDHPPIPSTNWLWAAYEAAFTAANLVREGFLGAIQFEEIDQTLSGFNRDLFARFRGPLEYAIKCKSTGYRSIIKTLAGIDNILDAAKETCGDDIVAIAFLPNADSVVRRLKINGSEWRKIPISPFFLSSFTVAVIYYLGVVTTWLVLWLDRKSSQFFSNRYLKTGKYPFTFVSAAIFLLTEITVFLVHNFASWGSA
jgi:hypothetical protein